MIVRNGMGEVPAVVISGAGRLVERGALGGEVSEAFKTFVSNVGGKVTGELDRVEMALKVAAYASAAAAVFSLISALSALYKKGR